MVKQARSDYAALADEHAALQKATRQIEESVMTMEVRKLLDRADMRRKSMTPSLEKCARTPIRGRLITTPSVTTLEVYRKRMAEISDEIIAAGRAAVLAEQFRRGSLSAQPPSLIEQRDITRHRRR